MQFSYNFHGIFKITISTSSKEIKEWFDREYHFFKDDDNENSHLYIEIKEVAPSISEKYYEVKDVCITEDRLIKKIGGWVFEFHNILGDGQSKVTTDCNNPNLLQHQIIENFMRYKAVFNNCAVVHSACIAKNDNCMVLFSLGETGKTTATLGLVEKGYEFLSDDMTFISEKGIAYSYQRSLHFSHKTHTAFNKDGLSLWKGTLKFFSRVLPKGFKLLLQKILPFHKLPNLIEQLTIDKIIPDVKYQMH